MEENIKLDIDNIDEFGRNLLQEAICSCQESVAKDLINNGIDINHQDNMGQTPLHTCAQLGNITIAKLLLQKRAKVNVIDAYGNTPLWYAVFYARDDYQMVKLFLKYGADTHHKNKAHRSPIDFAQQIEDTDLVKILLNNESSD